MENITLWYLTDNEAGEKTAAALRRMSLAVNIIEGSNLKDSKINQAHTNIFIFDLDDVEPRELIKYCAEDQRLRGMVKFVLATKKGIKSALSEPFNLYRLEFIKKPVETNEFLLLIEKTVLVESYRDIVKSLSKEQDSHIGAFEGLFSINRKNIFESAGKSTFEDIVNYQNNSSEENSRQLKSLRDFLRMSGGDVFDSAEEIDGMRLLSELRQKDLQELEGIFDERKNVIDYSRDESKQMMFSDVDLMDTAALRGALKKERSLSIMLAQEIEFLLRELDAV